MKTREFFCCVTKDGLEHEFVCFHPGHQWHGWLFKKQADGRLVSVRQLKRYEPPTGWVF